MEDGVKSVAQEATDYTDFLYLLRLLYFPIENQTKGIALFLQRRLLFNVRGIVIFFIIDKSFKEQ